MLKRIIFALAAAAAALGIALPASAATVTAHAHAPRTFTQDGIRFTADPGHPGIAYSAPVLIAYHSHPTYQVSGAGMDHALQLVHGTGGAYVIQANSEHDWKFHEYGDESRCIEWFGPFFRTAQCERGYRNQYMVPVDLSDGYNFRALGQPWVWSFREPPSAGRTIYAVAPGKSGYGQKFIFINLNTATRTRQQVHTASTFQSKLCLSAEQHACIDGRNPGQQAKLTHSSAVTYNWYYMKSTNTGNAVWQLETTGRGCLRGNGSGSVDYANCDATDTAQWWVDHESYNGVNRLANYKQTLWLGTWGTAPGRPLWLLGITDGFRAWIQS